ncbi:MAG: hypothetical protein RR400_02715 [Clostridia bacterium]
MAKIVSKFFVFCDIIIKMSVKRCFLWGIFLICFVVFGVCPGATSVFFVQAENGALGEAEFLEVFSEGDGSEIDPYLIKSASQLFSLAQFVNQDSVKFSSKKFFKLSNDVSLGGYRANGGWVPIGTSDNPFRGNFDGDNKKISGLFCDRPTLMDVGLFGSVCGNLQGVCVLGSVSGKANVGGICGSLIGGKIENCLNMARVHATGDFVGGIVGGMKPFDKSAAIVFGSINVGEIETDKNNAGGIAGGVSSSGLAECKILRCINNGSVISQNVAGGICGSLFASEISNTSNSGAIFSNNMAGGLVGVCKDFEETHCIIDASISIGKVSGSVFGFKGGLVGAMPRGIKISDCYYNFQAVGKFFSADSAIGNNSQYFDLKKDSGFFVNMSPYNDLWVKKYANNTIEIAEFVDNSNIEFVRASKQGSTVVENYLMAWEITIIIVLSVFVLFFLFALVYAKVFVKLKRQEKKIISAKTD